MLRIRLRRVGKKKRPAYRIVVADSRAPRDGAFIENLGLYDPLTDPATININEEKARTWLQQGAQPSDTVAKLLARQGLLPPRERAGSPGPSAPPAPPAPPESPEPAEPPAASE